jgi:hypothetical protein
MHRTPGSAAVKRAGKLLALKAGGKKGGAGHTGFCNFADGTYVNSRPAQAKTLDMEIASCHDSRARARGLHRRALFALLSVKQGWKGADCGCR